MAQIRTAILIMSVARSRRSCARPFTSFFFFLCWRGRACLATCSSLPAWPMGEALSTAMPSRRNSGELLRDPRRLEVAAYGSAFLHEAVCHELGSDMLNWSAWQVDSVTTAGWAAGLRSWPGWLTMVPTPFTECAVTGAACQDRSSQS